MFFVIIWLAKLAGSLSRWFSRGGGSALPGLLAEQSDSEILTQLAARLKGGSMVITGTNGKTTTTKMVQEILESVGYKVLTNKSGSNLSRGIVSTMVGSISWQGRFSEDIGLFEVDEASMPAVCAALKPKAVMVLNLFRDQLDRYGELDSTAAMIGRAIAPLETELYLNADDPLVASLAKYASPDQGPTLNPNDASPGLKVGPLSGDLLIANSRLKIGSLPSVHFFGVEAAESIKLEHDLAADSDHCPLDGAPLDYTKNFFGHIGHYSCPNSDFERPEPEISIANFKPGSAFIIRRGHDHEKLFLPLPGLYNAYNALAAVALTTGMGITLAKSTQALERVTAAFGRVERLEVEGRIVYLLLIKNPTGFNQIIQTFLAGNKSHHVMIAINDNFADGRDVSWLWDVAIEELKAKSEKPKASSREAGREPRDAQQVIVSGARALDMALRFKYADQEVGVEPDLMAAFRQTVAAASSGETVYVLPTYTAMLALREQVRTLGLVKGQWE